MRELTINAVNLKSVNKDPVESTEKGQNASNNNNFVLKSGFRINARCCCTAPKSTSVCDGVPSPCLIFDTHVFWSSAPFLSSCKQSETDSFQSAGLSACFQASFLICLFIPLSSFFGTHIRYPDLTLFLVAILKLAPNECPQGTKIPFAHVLKTCLV